MAGFDQFLQEVEFFTNKANVTHLTPDAVSPEKAKALSLAEQQFATVIREQTLNGGAENSLKTARDAYTASLFDAIPEYDRVHAPTPVHKKWVDVLCSEFEANIGGLLSGTPTNLLGLASGRSHQSYALLEQ